MELISVTKGSPDLRKIKRLFTHAFPKDERVPFGLLVKNVDPNKADFWGLYDDDFVGMAYVVKSPKLAYLYFFAISADKRGKGYGTAALAELKRRYADRAFLLALEALDEAADNYDQRAKRHAFYKRNGFTDLPYAIKEASVTYASMSIGDFPPDEYRAMMSDFLGERHMEKIDAKMFRE